MPQVMARVVRFPDDRWTCTDHVSQASRGPRFRSPGLIAACPARAALLSRRLPRDRRRAERAHEPEDIVVFLDALPASEERLRLATHVARNHRAHLGVVFVHDDQAVAEASGIVAGYGLISSSCQTCRVRGATQVSLADANNRCVNACAGSAATAVGTMLTRAVQPG